MIYTIINYENEFSKGRIVINNFTFSKRKDKISNKKYIDKVMKNLTKTKNTKVCYYETDDVNG